MEAYGTDAEFTAWLQAMGLSVPEGTSPAALRALGSTILDATYASRYSGRPVSATQALEWPRVGAYRGRTPLPSEMTPQNIVAASYFVAQYAANNPGTFFVGSSGSELVKRETIGPITTEYAVSASASPSQLAASLAPILPFVEGLIRPFLLDENEKSVFIMSVGL